MIRRLAFTAPWPAPLCAWRAGDDPPARVHGAVAGASTQGRRSGLWSALRGSGGRRQGDLDHAVLAVLELVVGLDDLVELAAVGEEGGQVDVAVQGHVEQATEPVAPRRAHGGDDAAHVEPSVDP